VGVRAHIGWRALLALTFSGAVAGFALPAIISSLIRQERHQPTVRLLRAPRLPSSETQPPQSESGAPPESQTGLTLRQLEQRARRTAPRIPPARTSRQSITSPHIAQGTHQLPPASAPAQTGSQTPKTTSTTTQPTTPKKNPKASTAPPKKQSTATPTNGSGNPTGGAAAP
jgi:hypothetical protein